jgi:hypothetical protein
MFTVTHDQYHEYRRDLEWLKEDAEELPYHLHYIQEFTKLLQICIDLQLTITDDMERQLDELAELCQQEIDQARIFACNTTHDKQINARLLIDPLRLILVGSLQDDGYSTNQIYDYLKQGAINV